MQHSHAIAIPLAGILALLCYKIVKQAFSLQRASAPLAHIIGETGMRARPIRRGVCNTVILVLTPLSLLRAQPGTLTTLHSFSGDNGDGAAPEAGVVIGSNGELYGTTLTAGASGRGIYGDGTVFRLTPPGTTAGTWTETVLHSFMGADGMSPFTPLLIGPSGVLYGTTRNGGTGANGLLGVAFALAPAAAAGGAWTYIVLHSFQGGTDGSQPGTGLVFGLNGALYGTTTFGGGGCKVRLNAGCGTAFELSPPALPGESWTETVLYAFGKGCYPSSVVGRRNGILFVATNDSSYDNGRVFRLSPAQAGEPWTHTAISQLGLEDTSGLTAGPNGVLYGASGFGGPSGYGAVYELTPPVGPGAPWTESVIHGFTYTNGDGAFPASHVTLAPNGALYGVTSGGGMNSACPSYQGCGTIYELAPPATPGAAWTETVLYSFTGGADGSYPTGGVALGPNGEMYGTTLMGGTSAACADVTNPAGTCGTVFMFTPVSSPLAAHIRQR